MGNILQLLADIISIVSIFIIAYGAIVSIVAFIRNELKSHGGAINDLRPIRATLGSYLLLGLEILIAALILKAILEPSYSALIVLGSIVAIRLLLSFFLNREIADLVAQAQPAPVVEKEAVQEKLNVEIGREETKHAH